MIDRALNGIIKYGTWIGQDMGRVHIALFVVDLLAALCVFLFVSLSMDAWNAIARHERVIETPQMAFMMMAALSLTVFHWLLWRSTKSQKSNRFSLYFFTSLILFCTIGFWMTKNIIAHADEKGYILCDPPQLAAYSRTNIRALTLDDCKSFNRSKTFSSSSSLRQTERT